MNPILQSLQSKQWVWKAANAKQLPSQKLSTGIQSLDNVLRGGFPCAGMIHLQSVLGCGELRLMLSILSTKQDTNKEQKLFVFIAPPFELNAEFLVQHSIPLEHLIVVHPNTEQEALWSAEQCAKSGTCYSIFIWHENLKHVQIRKLELASIQGNTYCIWMDSAEQASNIDKQNLPLSLSLSITRENDELNIKVNKQKVGWAQKPIKVPFPFSTRTNRIFNHRTSPNRANDKIVSIHRSR